MYIQKINFCVLGIIIMCFSIEKIETANATFYKNSFENTVSTPLNETSRIAMDPDFDRNLTTAIYAYGLNGSPNDSLTRPIVEALIGSNEKKNVILVDWEEEARGGPVVAIGYLASAAPNALKVGETLCQGLIVLKNAGVDLNKTQLAGHSLGSHVMGSAGKCLKSKGIEMPIIMGYDPAGPGFDQIFKGLKSTYGKAVIVIHTNPGKFGTIYSRGTADFWPNYSPVGLQPGCIEDGLTSVDLCSHNRVLKYVIESIESPQAFLSSSADNYIEWSTFKTLPNNTAYMGISVDPKSSGNYYLRTNGQAPYSKGTEGALPEQSVR